MRTNVFFRSTRRQPVKALCLALVIAFVTFAFVGRASEYLLIRQETERLEEYYRAAGSLNAAANGDLEGAVRLLEGSPYVKTADRMQVVSAVADKYNDGAVNHYKSILDGMCEDVFFYGTLAASGKWPEGRSAKDYDFVFAVDEVAVGNDSYIREGVNIALMNPITIPRQGGIYRATQEYRTEFRDMADLYGEMEQGVRYFVRARYYETDLRCVLQDFDSAVTDPEAVVLNSHLIFVPLVENGPWYLPVAEGEHIDLSDPRLAGLEEEMRLYDSNQHARRVLLTKDMSAQMLANWEVEPYLLEGRWIDAEDNAANRRVCVVPDGSGLAVGDTITLSIRDLADPDYLNGYLYSEADLARLGDVAQGPAEVYEVVGVFDTVREAEFDAYIFAPASALPEGFTQPGTFLGRGAFELLSPELEEAFLSEVREPLQTLGVTPLMAESGWASFRAAAEPLSRSALYNALIFTGILVASLCLAAFVYFRMRRKDLPIVRALGVPAGRCVGEAALPLLLIGLGGAAAGSALGWQYTLSHAAETLQGLSEFEDVTAVVLPLWWLAALGGAVLALLAALTVGGAHLLVRRPVLELMQGGAPAGQKPIPAGAVPQMPAMTAAERAAVRVYAPDASVPVRRKGGPDAGHVMRFVWRHIVRSRMKTALSVVLAAGFTVGLAAIQLSIVNSQERIEWLYDNTSVEAELVRTGEYSGASIRRKTLASLEESGYVTDVYLEASTNAGTGVYAYSGAWTDGVRRVTKEEQTRLPALAFEDADTFLSHIGSGSGVTITYMDGWDASLFSQEWTGAYDPERPFPVILPKAVYDQYGLGPGDLIVVLCRGIRPCEAAGYYEGAVTGDVEAPFLLPLSACQTMAGGRVSFSKAHMTLDHSLNRQLDTFVETVEAIASVQRISTLRAAIWDEELRQAVAPLERSITLMQVLYPVTLVLSLLAAAGISVLFIMTSSKEAAILRIQGTARIQTMVMLSLQQVFPSLAGLAAGLAGISVYIGGIKPALMADLIPGAALCAALYFLAGVTGAAVSSAAVTGKNPLEMLQVKE